MVIAEDISAWLALGLKDAIISVEGDGHHFEAVIVTAAFEGKNLLQRQRMVYAVLGDKMGGEIHALSMKTLTPAEASQRGAVVF